MFDYIKNKSNLKLLLLFLSIGFDRFYSNYIQIDIFKSIPLIYFVSPFLISKAEVITILKELKPSLRSPFVFMLITGIITGIIHFSNSSLEKTSYIPFFKQTISFSIGIILFFYLSTFLKKYDMKTIISNALISSVPFLCVGLFQLVLEKKVFSHVRSIGLFSEPSYYAQYLTCFIFPFFVGINSFAHDYRSKFLFFLISLFAVFNLIWTQSGTGLLAFLMLGFFYFLFIDKKKLYKTKIAIPSVLAVSALVIFSISQEDSYVKMMSMRMLDVVTGKTPATELHSFYDRFYHLVLVLSYNLDLSYFFGHGFGSDYLYFNRLFPTEIQSQMILDKPTLSFLNSFLSKILFYNGLFSVLFYAYAIRLTLVSKNFFNKVGLATTIVTSIWGIANFSIPYFWFWLALAYNEYLVISPKASALLDQSKDLKDRSVEPAAT